MSTARLLVGGIMRFSLLVTVIFIALNASGQTPANKLWTELKTKRETLPGLHQEFEVTQTFKTIRGIQSSHREVVLDMSADKWRERSVSGSGDRIRIFDGQDLFLMEAEGDEYVRTKHKPKEDNPAPTPYGSVDLDLGKAKEVERRPCGFSENDHACIIIDVPVEKWIRAGTNDQITKMLDGTTLLAIDSETGVLVKSNTQEVIENRRGAYQVNLTYSLKRMSYGAVPDAGLFKLPESGVHEVRNSRVGTRPVLGNN
jgi:hypothetical protein